MRYFVLLIILFSFNSVFSQSDRKHARDGNKNYFDSLFVKSEVDYRKALAKNPSFDIEANEESIFELDFEIITLLFLSFL